MDGKKSCTLHAMEVRMFQLIESNIPWMNIPVRKLLRSLVTYWLGWSFNSFKNIIQVSINVHQH